MAEYKHWLYEKQRKGVLITFNQPEKMNAFSRRLIVKMQIFVMPAWIAGIQARTVASGDFHVNLDSSTPCWNDTIEGFCSN